MSEHDYIATDLFALLGASLGFTSVGIDDSNTCDFIRHRVLLEGMIASVQNFSDQHRSYIT